MKMPILCVAICVGCGTPKDSEPSAAASSAFAQVPAPVLPITFDVSAVDQYISKRTTSPAFVGLSIAIVRNGVVVLSKGYGRRHIDPDAPVQSDTPFAVASITKQFVSALVLLLAREKKLSLEDRLSKYYPYLTRANDITLYDLMTHVSGYRDNYPLDFVDREMKQRITPDEIIREYATRPLDFEPRTKFSYSSTGYKILGRVLEKVTRKPLRLILAERILKPLGMTRSFYVENDDGPDVARGYTAFALGPPEPAIREAHDWSYGSGGLYASAGDIAKWDIALMSGVVLDSEDYKLFSTPRQLADGRSTGYGCGIETILNRAGDTILRHSGRSSGFVADNVMVPRIRAAVVVLSNRDDAAPWELTNQVISLLNKEHRPPPLAVVGAPTKKVAEKIFLAIQSGNVERGLLGADFNAFLTDAKLQGAGARLRVLGALTKVEVEDTHERGGMEESTSRLTLGAKNLKAVMSRSPDGKVQQFLIYDH